MGQDLDSQIGVLSKELARQLKERGVKRLAVFDFAELDGSTSGLGRYIAEQLNIELVAYKKDFAVMDRANLDKIRDELKLSATGQVDPESAKKVGKLAGVDAFILGNYAALAETVSVQAKVITSETSEMVAARSVKVKRDKDVDLLLSSPLKTTGSKTGVAALKDEKPVFVKSFGDFVVQVKSLRIVNNNQYLLTIVLTNQSATKAIWVAINGDLMNNVKGVLTDAHGTEFVINRLSLTGIPVGNFSKYGYVPNTVSAAAQIAPNETTVATMKFDSTKPLSMLEPGACHLQLEYLTCTRFDSSNGAATGVSYPNLTTQMEAK